VTHDDYGGGLQGAGGYISVSSASPHSSSLSQSSAMHTPARQTQPQGHGTLSPSFHPPTHTPGAATPQVAGAQTTAVPSPGWGVDPAMMAHLKMMQEMFVRAEAAVQTGQKQVPAAGHTGEPTAAPPALAATTRRSPSTKRVSIVEGAKTTTWAEGRERLKDEIITRRSEAREASIARARSATSVDSGGTAHFQDAQSDADSTAMAEEASFAAQDEVAAAMHGPHQPFDMPAAGAQPTALQPSMHNDEPLLSTTSQPQPADEQRCPSGGQPFDQRQEGTSAMSAANASELSQPTESQGSNGAQGGQPTLGKYFGPRVSPPASDFR